MAENNMHTLDDLERRPLTNSSSQKNPRDETFFSTMKDLFCQDLEIQSFTTFISAGLIGVYVAMLILSGASDNGFLGISSNTLFIFGDKYPYYMKYDLQLWRFLTTLCLHASLNHLVLTLILMVIIGSRMEKSMGHFKFLFLFVLSGAGGVLFSSVYYFKPTCGATPAIFGLVGSQIAWMIHNWAVLDRDPNLKCNFIMMTLVFIFLPLMFNSSQMNDTFANFGGVLYGTLLGLIVVASVDNNGERSNWLRWLAGILVLGGTGALVTMFYLISTPKKY